MSVLTRQRNQTLIGSIVAVVAALSLASIASYPILGSAPIKAPESACMMSPPFPILNLPPTLRVEANGTVQVGSVDYSYVTFASGFVLNKSTIMFGGVNFTLEATPITKYESATITVGGPPINFTWTGRGTQRVTLYDGSQYCGQSIPRIGITFSDGAVAEYVNDNVTIHATDAGIWIDRPLGTPWFTQHGEPRAGIGYQLDGSEITLYISA